ncbi:Pseudouridylate synthase [Candidatus Phytoplasma mali]|uniref:Pseudouridine synthase n=1 Tax=Phytoplasma mali (strain AT) TaxID=482235 RepID=B3QZS4_PHYMT|nr:RluA family pseudouridine synthase [Candidatus Phytoplasma mali]CAP18461.1 Pseudouridylate synthase [Candidatus Phytoplasma mali]
MGEEFFIIDVEKGMRLDHFLNKKINFSKNRCQKLIILGKILVNNKPSKKSYILKENDHIKVFIPSTPLNVLQPIDLNLEIIYEDEFLAVIDKPKNLVIHPSITFSGVTLINGLLFQIKNFRKMDGLRPGIVHRLDKDTTGLILVAKSEEIRQQLQLSIQKREIKRYYWALIHGHLEKQGKIILPIGRHPHNRIKMAVVKNGKPSITYFKVLKYFNNFSLIECQLETGRTHQIRVHLSYLKHHILGDKLYGLKENCYSNESQFLHSKKIEFIHPITKKNIFLESILPIGFQNVVKKLSIK